MAMTALLFSLLFCLKISFGQAPEIDFNKYYWPVNKPGGGTQTSATSGEDWYYDVKYTLEDGKPYGFVGAGYSSFPNVTLSHGCGNYPLENNTGDGNDYNFAIPMPNSFGWAQWGTGPVIPKIGFINKNGQQTWYNTYGSSNGKYGSGVFYNILQTSDEGYIAVGKLQVGNAMKYNPTNSAPAGSTFGCKTGPALGEYQGYIAKTDIEGNLQWHFLYGYEDNVTNALERETFLYEVIPFTSGNYLVLGKSIQLSTGKELIVLFKINSSGVIQQKVLFTNQIQSGFTELGNIGRRMIYVPAQNAVYISGMLFKDTGNTPDPKKALAMVIKVNTSTLLPTGTPFLLESSFSPATYEYDNIAFDIEYDATQSRLLTALIIDDKCGDCGENFRGAGTGLVYQLSPVNLTTIGTNPIANIGSVTAIDLTTTSDGGFAVTSTKQSILPTDCAHPFAPWTLGSCAPNNNRKYDKRVWATDCYVAKYNSSNTFLWSKSITESTPNASYGNYDFNNIPPQTQGNVGNPILQGDLKRQECLYKIVRVPYDDGLVICGNNSNNMDDDVIIKLHSNCQKTQTYDITTNQSINSNVTWNSSKKINAEIQVNNGGILTITGASTVIQFSDTRQVGKAVRLIVQPGGKLIINNGAKVTGMLACPNSTWEGIMVLGNQTLSQLPATNQGVIEITSANVENARNAVTAGTMAYSLNAQGQVDFSLDMYPFNGLAGGGIIRATNANFINNKVSVRFNAYAYYSSPGVEVANYSYFNTSNFKVDNNMNSFIGLEEFVFLNGVGGLNFKGCKFENNKTNLTEDEEMGTGIFSVDAGFNVQVYCLTTPCSTSIRSNFKNLWYGIRGTRISSSRTFTVDKTDFAGNIFGVKSEGVNNIRITSNAFVVGNSPAAQTSNSGVYVETGTGYIIEENTFTKPATTTSTPIGVTIRNTGANTNEVYKNTYTQMGTGNLSNLQNRNSTGSVGLQFLCNNYITSLNIDEAHTTLVLPIEGLKTSQGLANLPAGNIFSNASYNIFNFANNTMQYYYAATAPNENPSVVVNVQKFSAPLNSCPSHLSGGGGGGFFVQGNNENQTTYYQSKLAAENYQALLEQLIDGGNTEQLKNEIALSLPQQTMELRNELLNKSPYLSEDVLKEAAENTDALPDEILFEVLYANPDVLRTDSFMLFLEQKSVPLPQWMLDLLELQKGTITAKTLLEAGIEYHKSQMDLATRFIINDILSKDVEGAEVNHLELREWLSNPNTLSSDYAVIEDYLTSGEANTALEMAGNIEQLRSMDEIEAATHANLMTIYNLQAALINKNKGWDSLNTEQIEEIKKIAEDTLAGFAEIKARNILRAYYRAKYDSSPILAPDASALKNSKTETKKKEIENRLTIYPNPANGYLIISYKTKLSPDASLTITDAIGKTVYQASLENAVGQKVVNTSQLPNGTYYYKLSGQDYKDFIGKFVVVH